MNTHAYVHAYTHTHKYTYKCKYAYSNSQESHILCVSLDLFLRYEVTRDSPQCSLSTFFSLGPFPINPKIFLP